MAVKRYDGSAWQVVAGKGDQGTSSSISTWVKTASGGETSLSGNDDNSQSLSYTVGQELVFINGTLLKRGSDYTATNGTSITGLTALAANDVATVWTVNAFSVTNAISSGLVTTTGDIIYASAANTPARLGIGSTDQVLKVSGGVPAWGAAPAASFSGCYASNTTNQTIADQTWTTVTWNNEIYDTDSYHSTSTNTGRFTIPTGKSGYYQVIFNWVFAANATQYRDCRIRKNGTGGAIAQQYGITSNVATPGQPSLVRIIYLAAGDYIEAQVIQGSGGNLNLLCDAQDDGYITSFLINYLGA